MTPDQLKEANSTLNKNTYGNMGGLRLRNLLVGKHLVDVGIHHDPLEIWRGLKIVPGAEWLESVVDQFNGV